MAGSHLSIVPRHSSRYSRLGVEPTATVKEECWGEELAQALVIRCAHSTICIVVHTAQPPQQHSADTV
ncbi:hypothetical protein JZ751_004217 [Albula glossodonta]|uniref:Uncharacterized protein n=1 Tax=Albula glossodonta TaxID=121402 RepID=A0A8T2ND80_9TELE|nr:hypothetical protein JZ751_004217 [Albula glossodonta]